MHWSLLAQTWRLLEQTGRVLYLCDCLSEVLSTSQGLAVIVHASQVPSVEVKELYGQEPILMLSLKAVLHLSHLMGLASP